MSIAIAMQVKALEAKVEELEARVLDLETIVTTTTRPAKRPNKLSDEAA